MKLRQFAVIAGLLTAAVVSGSPPTVHTPQTPVAAGEVLDLDGLHDVDFGDTESELTRRGILRTDVAGCGPTLAGHETISPVFIDDRLVLLWLGDSTRTPQGVTVGTPLDELRTRYPELTPLDAPQGTYRFDGLLARHGDRAYLFLHDGREVRKIIAGYADWARRLFEEGVGPC
ncbi:hypothetical protein OG994_26370 [Micromonospora globbae]|uniref:Uncharacterized protein n=1 Tax=Micromonospora globbae TaxID=1894969 RepID=A0ABZ1S4U5_9ACTN|nr:hypothetical protein OH732_31015 [Micromonospora globbae]